MDRPLNPKIGKGKEVWDFVRIAFGIPATARKAVITFDYEEVIRVEVEYFPTEEFEVLTRPSNLDGVP